MLTTTNVTGPRQKHFWHVHHHDDALHASALYTELMICTMAVFKDKTVLILMVLITIFDLESDDQIKRIRDSYLLILKRYLEENTKNDAEFDMKNILKCIKALPKVYKIFMDMSDTQKESKQGSLLSIT